MDTFPRLAVDRTNDGVVMHSGPHEAEAEPTGTPGQHQAQDAVVTIDAASRITFMNAVAEEMTGWTDAEARGQPLAHVVSVVDEVSRFPVLETLMWRARKEAYYPLCECVALLSLDQHEYSIAGTIVAMRDTKERYAGCTIVFRDLSPVHRLEQQVTDHACSDPLTGLVNRQEFDIRAEELIYDAERTGQSHTALFLDVDHFAILNDTYGRGAGDALLRQVAQLLQGALKPADTLARLGNDEFGILLYGCGIDDALRTAEGLLRSVQQSPFSWRTRLFNLSVSIGLALAPAGVGQAASLGSRREGTAASAGAAFLTGADAACEHAKKRGGNRVCIYRNDDAELASRRNQLQWATGVAKAIYENRMCLDVQPIAPSERTGERGFSEVLLRMTDEHGNRVPPDTFIPAAERYHLMPQVDRWVISNALAALKRRHLAGDTWCRFAINVSGASLCDDRLAEYVREQLIAHDVPAAAVCFEITETAAVENLACASAFIDDLRGLGCSFALDDFGRGQSSFAHLKHLAVDYLKIDGMFVTGMLDNEIDQAMVRAFNWIGHVRGLKTIAEHVESDAMLHKLREIGVDYVQGYGIARPAPSDAQVSVANGA